MLSEHRFKDHPIFGNYHITGFTQINFINGRNESGKTSLINELHKQHTRAQHGHPTRWVEERVFNISSSVRECYLSNKKEIDAVLKKIIKGYKHLSFRKGCSRYCDTYNLYMKTDYSKSYIDLWGYAPSSMTCKINLVLSMYMRKGCALLIDDFGNMLDMSSIDYLVNWLITKATLDNTQLFITFINPFVLDSLVSIDYKHISESIKDQISFFRIGKYVATGNVIITKKSFDSINRMLNSDITPMAVGDTYY